MRSSFGPPFLLKFLLLLLGFAAKLASANDLLQLEVVGTNTNSSRVALAKAQQDVLLILNRFVAREGPGWTAIAPGQVVNRGGRMLRGGDEEGEIGAVDQEHRGLQWSCGSWGCSCYCCRCRRQERELQPISEQRVVEADLTVNLQQYCGGEKDCAIMARVWRVNTDGSVVRAD